MECMTDSIGHICGRFHPFHVQHLDYAEWAASSSDKLVIGITNADKYHIEQEDKEGKRHKEKHNPFTYFERHQMIRAAVEESSVEIPVDIMPFPINKPELWNNYASKDVTHYIKVAEEWHDEKAERLRKKGRKAVTGSRNRMVSGEEIRDRIAEGDISWKKDVPEAVAEYIQKNELEQRIRKLYNKNKSSRP